METILARLASADLIHEKTLFLNLKEAVTKKQ